MQTKVVASIKNQLPHSCGIPENLTNGVGKKPESDSSLVQNKLTHDLMAFIKRESPSLSALKIMIPRFQRFLSMCCHLSSTSFAVNLLFIPKQARQFEGTKSQRGWAISVFSFLMIREHFSISSKFIAKNESTLSRPNSLKGSTKRTQLGGSRGSSLSSSNYPFFKKKIW